MIDYMILVNRINQLLPLDHLTALQISIIWACILLFANGILFFIFSIITYFVEKYHFFKLKKVKLEVD